MEPEGPSTPPPAAPPAATTAAAPAPPPVLIWQRVFVGVVAAFWLTYVLAGFFVILLASAFVALPRDRMPFPIHLLLWGEGVVFILIGLVGAGIYLVSYLFPRRPWVWVYHVVLLGLSAMTCYCLPFAIPLLIYWTNAETRAWYGMKA